MHTGATHSRIRNICAYGLAVAAILDRMRRRKTIRQHIAGLANSRQHRHQRAAIQVSILSHNIYENIRTRTIVLHRGHTLLLPAIGSAPPDGRVVWRLPGGGLEPHETLAECARREVLEETGLAVRVGRIAFLLEWVAPRFAQTAESGNSYGFGLEVFHYATLEDLIPELPEPRRERPGLIPPRWVPLAQVPNLPLWPKELKLLCRRLHEGRVPATGVSIIGRLESPLAVAEHDPFAEPTL